MSKHTQEPWKVQHPHAGQRGWEIADSSGLNQVSQDVTEANARRIVACVNACAGVDTALLEAGELDNPTMLVIQENKDLKHRCDELLAVLEGVLAVVSDSAGVAGYHLNGDIADWGEFDEINAVYAAITKAKGITAA